MHSLQKEVVNIQFWMKSFKGPETVFSGKESVLLIFTNICQTEIVFKKVFRNLAIHSHWNFYFIPYKSQKSGNREITFFHLL